MGPKENRDDQDSLKHLGGQAVVLLTFMLNLMTTIGVIWTIFKFGLNNESPQRLLFSLDSNPPASPLDQILLFHRDIVADKLIVKDRLGLDTISHEQISLIGGNNNNKGAPVGIFLRPDRVSMQAKSFGANVSLDSQFSFQIHREVDEFDVSSDINSVRSIVSPMTTNEDGSSGRQHQDRFGINSNLAIDSPDQLELSGNMGANFHSKHMELVSKDRISIESKESVIIIRSSDGGLYLPNLQLYKGNYDQVGTDDDGDESNYVKNFISTGPVNRRSQLCVSRSDGMLYKSQFDCHH